MRSATVVNWIVVIFVVPGLYGVEANQIPHHHRREHFYVASTDSEQKESDSAALDELIYSIERASLPGLQSATVATTEPPEPQEVVTDPPGARRGVM
ncbi:hypothetical protein Y032_0036g3304 [Ancylostoma ceylanicum]|uniref:Uncharacterized protein n=1 Tax=Ancylostoma ceylanicum TaxID=53326 RepID=A0A016UJZ4_9BILA|nr:hypothetical protein Y032_0036g3304 [Ancylostoma ceylanicum]